MICIRTSITATAKHAMPTTTTDHLVRSGLPRTPATRAATLVDATFIGLQLDQELARRTYAGSQSGAANVA